MSYITLLLYIIYTLALYIIASWNIDYLEIIENDIFCDTTIYVGKRSTKQFVFHLATNQIHSQNPGFPLQYFSVFEKFIQMRSIFGTNWL